jgi:hypothetical protein
MKVWIRVRLRLRMIMVRVRAIKVRVRVRVRVKVSVSVRVRVRVRVRRKDDQARHDKSQSNFEKKGRGNQESSILKISLIAHYSATHPLR